VSLSARIEGRLGVPAPAWITLVLALSACGDEPVPAAPPAPTERRVLCTQLAPFDGMRNHLQPFAVAVDAEHRRAYSASLWHASLGVFDLDSAEPLAMTPTGPEAPTEPGLAVGWGGEVWLLSSSTPALVRFRSPSGGRAMVAEPLRHADSAVPVGGGAMVVLGTLRDGEQVLQRIGPTGAAGDAVPMERRGRHLVPLHDGRLAVLMQGGGEGGLSIRDPGTLAQVASCDLPFEANYGAGLEDGTVVVAEDERIGLAGCDGAEPKQWRHGTENREVVSIGGAALVLDRTGGEGGDPHRGMAWWVDSGGIQLERSFPTGKHTGHGAYDPVKERVWLNAKGTSELLVMDPSSGSVDARLRTGTYLDGLALDPELDDVVYGVGRLSNTVVRVEGAEATAWNEDVFWPFTPVVDPGRDLVWVLSQGRSTVHGLSRSDLSERRVLDPQLEPDRFLTFGSIALHPTRGTLFLAQGELDLVLELEPDSGAVLGRWELGGPLIQERTDIGQLWLQIDPQSGSILVARSNDARVVRLDPDQGVVATARLGSAVADALSEGTSMEFARLVEPDLLYVGGTALDAVSLKPRPESDLDAALVLGHHPDGDAGLLGVSSDSLSFVLFDGDGQPRRQRGFATRALPSLRYALDEQRGELVMIRAREGRICWFPLAELEPVPGIQQP